MVSMNTYVKKKELQIVLLTSLFLAECQTISMEFSSRSKVGFTNCIGCMDGLLIWLEKPLKEQCNEVGVDSGKFSADERESSVSTFKEYVMPDNGLHIF